MDIQTLILVVGFVGALVLRIDLIEVRSSTPMRSRLLSTTISFFSTISLYSIIVLAFMLYTWWIVIISILGFVMLAGVIINARNLGFFFGIKILLNILILIFGTLTWLSYL